MLLGCRSLVPCRAQRSAYWDVDNFRWSPRTAAMLVSCCIYHSVVYTIQLYIQHLPFDLLVAAAAAALGGGS